MAAMVVLYARANPTPVTFEDIVNVRASEDQRTRPYYTGRFAEFEMFPRELRERYEYLFHVPLPEYVTAIRGLRVVMPRGDSEQPEGRSGVIHFYVPNAHLGDYRRHIIEELGVAEEALVRQFGTGTQLMAEMRNDSDYPKEFFEDMGWWQGQNRRNWIGKLLRRQFGDHFPPELRPFHENMDEIVDHWMEQRLWRDFVEVTNMDAWAAAAGGTRFRGTGVAGMPVFENHADFRTRPTLWSGNFVGSHYRVVEYQF